MMIGVFIFISFASVLHICCAQYAAAAAGGATASATSYASSGTDPYGYGAANPQYYSSQYINNNGFNQYHPQAGYMGHYSHSAAGAAPRGQYYGISGLGPQPLGQYSRAGRPPSRGQYYPAAGLPWLGQYFQVARPPPRGEYYEMSGAGQPPRGRYPQAWRQPYAQAGGPPLRGLFYPTGHPNYEISGAGQLSHEEYPLAIGQPSGEPAEPSEPPTQDQQYQPPGLPPLEEHYKWPQPLEQDDSLQNGSPNKPGQQSTSSHTEEPNQSTIDHKPPNSTIDITSTLDRTPMITTATTQQSAAVGPTPSTEVTHENLIMKAMPPPMVVTYQPRPETTKPSTVLPTQNRINKFNIIYPNSPLYVPIAKESRNTELQDQATQIDERRR